MSNGYEVKSSGKGTLESAFVRCPALRSVLSLGTTLVMSAALIVLCGENSSTKVRLQ